MINIVLFSYVMLVQSRRANLAHHQELLDLLEQQIFLGFYKKVWLKKPQKLFCPSLRKT